MATKKFKGLGRGLEALLGPKLDESTSLDAASADLPNQLALSDLFPHVADGVNNADERLVLVLNDMQRFHGAFSL